MKWLLILFLILVIIQDIKYYTISIYNLIGLGVSGFTLNHFSLWSLFLGLEILLGLSLYIKFYLKKEMKNAIGLGDIFLLSILFSITPIDQFAFFLFFSGFLSIVFYYMFNKKYVPLGAGISTSYVFILFFI